MKTRSVALLLAALFVAALLATGCLSNSNLAETAANGVAPEGYSFTESQGVSTNDSESHQMIAKMRLLSQGMSPNLDDYDFVELVEMKNAETGEMITVVVVSDGDKQTAILPEDMTSNP